MSVTHTTAIGFRQSGSDVDYADIGGTVIEMKAAGTLLCGDVVYISAADTVAKHTTVANYDANTGIGVVVGGAATNMQYTRTTVGGVTAALVNQRVLVQINGVAECVSGAALVTIGSTVRASAVTAGRLGASAATAWYLGTLLSTAVGAAEVVKVLIRPGIQET